MLRKKTRNNMDELKVIGYADQAMVDENPGLGLEVGMPLYEATHEHMAEAKAHGEFVLGARQEQDTEECESCSA